MSRRCGITVTQVLQATARKVKRVSFTKKITAFQVRHTSESKRTPNDCIKTQSTPNDCTRLTCVGQDSHHHVHAARKLIHLVSVVPLGAGDRRLGSLDPVQLPVSSVLQCLQGNFKVTSQIWHSYQQRKATHSHCTFRRCKYTAAAGPR